MNLFIHPRGTCCCPVIVFLFYVLSARASLFMYIPLSLSTLYISFLLSLSKVADHGKGLCKRGENHDDIYCECDYDYNNNDNKNRKDNTNTNNTNTTTTDRNNYTKNNENNKKTTTTNKGIRNANASHCETSTTNNDLLLLPLLLPTADYCCYRHKKPSRYRNQSHDSYDTYTCGGNLIDEHIHRCLYPCTCTSSISQIMTTTNTYFGDSNDEMQICIKPSAKYDAKRDMTNEHTCYTMCMSIQIRICSVAI